MKKFRVFSLILAMTMSVALMLTGCTGKSASYDYGEAGAWDNSYSSATTEAYWAEEDDWGITEVATESLSASTEDVVDVNQANDSKLIYTADVHIETVNYEDTVAQIHSLMASNNGYIEMNDTTNYGGYRSCYITIRVPRENYRSFVTNVSGLEMVVSFSESVENVSQAYYDTEMRLASAIKELEGYQALYQEATDVEDMITIASAINDVQFRIDSLNGTLRYYDALVGYSTVSIDVDEVSRLRGQETPTETFGQRFNKALATGWANAVEGMQDLVLGIARGWFGWLIFIIIVVVAVLLIKRSIKKKKARQAAAMARMPYPAPQMPVMPAPISPEMPAQEAEKKD